MKITSDQWTNYIKKLSTLNSRGSELVQDWIDKHGTEDVDALIDYCYRVIGRYGTASAELTASMYEAIAQAEEMFIQPAELAEIASYGDTAKAVQGSLLQSPSGQLVKQAVSRQIKLASADTLAKNALRDGAEWAWIPSGDTCPFCLMLASQGWVKASKKALKNGHCKHIHANCDCTYAVRFSHDTDVAGYDPERYLADYEGADGSKPREKLNAMRRERYEANKGKINAQKRAAYAVRVENRRENSIIELNNDRYTIAEPKISKFLLKPGAKHSAEFFDVGYTEQDGAILNTDIYKQFDDTLKTDIRIAEDGTESFSIFMELGTTKKRTFRTVWQRDPDSEKPRFITAHREDKK